jgi:predicted aspartyl protease
VNHIDDDQSTYSTTVSLRVNDRDLNFQMDTGATDTIININDWYKLGSPTLRSSQLIINCYNGARLQVKGKCDVKVQYKNQYFNLPIIVINGNKPSLLGLNWIKILQFDVNQIVHRSSYATHSVHHVYTLLDQTNKPTKFRKQLQNYRSISNTSTGHSPAKKLQQRPIQKIVNKFESNQSAVPHTRAKYHVNQLVWTLDHPLNHRSKWQAALIKRNLGSMVYEVRFNNGQCYKRHENQLRPRSSSHKQLFETNNLSDDLLNKMLQYNTIRPRQLF